MRRAASRELRCLLFVYCFLSFDAPILFASQVRPLNLEELTQRADRIFSGRCLDVQVGEDPELHRVVTTVTMTVTRKVKGAVHGRVVFKMLGSQDAEARSSASLEGMPLFKRGEEAVLFLYGDSALGLTSPVGFGNGKFAVVADKQGRRHAVNGFGNEHLFSRLSPEAERKLEKGISSHRGRKAIPVDDVLDMVEKLGSPAGPHAP